MPARNADTRRPPRPVIGWREWLALPGLGVDRIKAKIDTGARTSSLHAFDIERFRRRGVDMVRFQVHPVQRDLVRTIVTEARLVDERWVRDSGGKATLRPVIHTDVHLLDQTWEIELTLTRRDVMGFRMLLGRQAVRRRFLVDPGRSYFGEKARRRTTGRRAKERP
jgi:hypothetical protein